MLRGGGVILLISLPFTVLFHIMMPAEASGLYGARILTILVKILLRFLSSWLWREFIVMDLSYIKVLSKFGLFVSNAIM